MVATVQKFPLQCLEDTIKGVTASCGPELYWQPNLTIRIAPGFVWELPCWSSVQLEYPNSSWNQESFKIFMRFTVGANHSIVIGVLNLPRTTPFVLPFPLSFHDEGRYHIETSPSICGANQWTGFYMIMTSIMIGLNEIPGTLVIVEISRSRKSPLEMAGRRRHAHL